MTYLSRLPVVLAILLAACPETTQPPEPTDKIESLQKIVQEGYNDGDAAAIIGVYADNAIMMLSNQPAIVGKPAIAEAVRATLAANTFGMRLSTDEIQWIGDRVFSRGAYAVSITPEEGDDIEDKGKYVNLFQLQPDGEWKLTRHIRNSDKPARCPDN